MSAAKQFGRNLAYCRKRAGISQEALSARASIHQTAVGMIERGQRMPRGDTIVKLAASLGIDPGELFDGITWTPGSVQPGAFGEDAK